MKTHIALFSVIALLIASCAQSAEKDIPAMDQKNHTINYVEMSAENLAAFKKFYGDVFGWTFRDWGPDYISFEGAGVDGGVFGSQAPVNGTTIIILYADDLDATEKAVVAAGGEVTSRHEFPGGKRFHFLDTTGNELAVWTKVE